MADAAVERALVPMAAVSVRLVEPQPFALRLPLR
jgi:hypothetical protein